MTRTAYSFLGIGDRYVASVTSDNQLYSGSPISTTVVPYLPMQHKHIIENSRSSWFVQNWTTLEYVYLQVIVSVRAYCLLS